MSLKVTKSYLLTILIILFFVQCTIGQFLFGLVGLHISGLDYLSYLAYLFLILIINNDTNLKIDHKYLLLVLIFISINILNLFVTKYTTTILYYMIGLIISLIPISVFIVFSNIRIKYKNYYHLIKLLHYVILIIILISVIDSFVSSVESNSVYWTRILKSSAFLGTLCVINVAFALFLYIKERKSHYLITLIILSVIVLTSALLKSLLALAFLITLFLYQFYSKKKFVLGIVVIFSALIISVVSVDFVKTKIQRYTQLYLLSESTELVPRNLLYLTSFKIAKDNFPFGSGQGTFGSYPVNSTYSDVYYDYGLATVHGLSEESAFGLNNKPNYLLDTFWSSIIGENGFIGGLIYLSLFFYPLKLMREKRNKLNYKSHYFIVAALIGVLFIESLVLSLLSQMTFIFFYSGITGLTYKQLKNSI